MSANSNINPACIQVQAFINRSDKSDLTVNPGLDREAPLTVPDPDHDTHDGGDGGSPDHEQDGGGARSYSGDLNDPNGVPDSHVTAVLGEQLQEALNDKQKLADELLLERDRNTQLENQVALGKINFL